MARRPDTDYDVIIVGGGVIGASIAWRLARNHLRVLLADARAIGSEASTAAAGMLAPGGEFDQPSPMLDFAIGSLGRYQNFVAEIEADSGLPIEFRRTSAIQIALTHTELESLIVRAALQRTAGIPSTVLTKDQLHALAPLVRSDAIGAVHYANEAIVDAAGLMTALRAACLVPAPARCLGTNPSTPLPPSSPPALGAAALTLPSITIPTRSRAHIQ
jgi:glycine oxidase